MTDTAPVLYADHGRLLVMGDAACVARIWPQLAAPLTPYALLDAGPVPSALPGTHALAGITGVRIAGWLGAFTVHAEQGGEVLAVHERLLGPDGRFDRILDLSPAPRLSRPVLPPGYHAPGGDPTRLEAALDELAEAVGVFEKPRYFHFDPALCAHGGPPAPGCHACLSVCGAEAIESAPPLIRVNPALCQGCGDCATACPSGALRYTQPAPAVTLASLAALLRAGPVPAPWIAPVSENTPAPPSALALPVEALGVWGMEIWLAALAFGAAGIALVDHAGLSALTRANLRQQTATARALLAALGHDPNRICFDPAPACPAHAPLCPPARFAPLDDKRRVLELALEHLARHAPRPSATAQLPADAPFGQIRIDAARCTLCLACVSLCPPRALQDGRDEPALRLIEAHCVQCGRCRAGCPEQAITLEPRYLFDRVSARAPRVLLQQDAVLCPGCGRPYANRALLDALTPRLKNHPMFQGKNARLLALCGDCRIRAQFSA